MQLIRDRGVKNVKDGNSPWKAYGLVRDEMTSGKPWDTRRPALATFLTSGPGLSGWWRPEDPVCVGPPHTHTWCGCLSDTISQGPHDRHWLCGLPSLWTSVLCLWNCWWEVANARHLCTIRFQLPAPQAQYLRAFSDPCFAQGAGQVGSARECAVRLRPCSSPQPMTAGADGEIP